jgi:hypothetical protein
VVERQHGRPAISTASLGDVTLFGAGGGASALTMHAASQRASLLPSARHAWRRGHRAFFRSLLVQVRQDVHDPTEWIARVKAPNAPRLIDNVINDLKLRGFCAVIDLVDIVDLNRQIGNGGPRPALARNAELRRR